MLQHRSRSLSTPLRQTSTYLQECHFLTHIRVKERSRDSIGTSLANFPQQGYNGAVTSKSNLIRFLQSHFLGHFNTASSLSATVSYALQGRHRASRTPATTTTPTSLVLENMFSETSGTSRHKSYVCSRSTTTSTSSSKQHRSTSCRRTLY